MGRNTIDTSKHIKNDKKRRTCLNKRTAGFLKKGIELSTLCGIDIKISFDSNEYNDIIKDYLKKIKSRNIELYGSTICFKNINYKKPNQKLNIEENLFLPTKINEIEIPSNLPDLIPLIPSDYNSEFDEYNEMNCSNYIYKLDISNKPIYYCDETNDIIKDEDLHLYNIIPIPYNDPFMNN